MENQIIKQENQTSVVLAGERLSLPKEILQNLPEIVRNEIEFPKLNGKNEESQISRADTTSRIISMLDVKFKGDTIDEQKIEMDLATMEFRTFLRGYYLTGKEVIEAYRMALSGEIEYKVYPTLSLIQCGEILKLYNDFKINSPLRDSGIKTLKLLLEPPKIEKSEAEKRMEEIGTYKRIYNEIKTKGFSDKAFVLYEDLESKGKLKTWDSPTKKRFFKRVKVKFLKEKEDETKSGAYSRILLRNLINDNDLLNSLIKSRCREIFVSNYLKKHCKSFNEFINALK